MNARPELQQLRVLLAIAEQGSYRRAARALELSPSALSQAISRLEAQLGLPLLQRSTRSVSLTAPGQQLVQAARAALHQLDGTLAELAHWREQPGGSLRLSVPRSAARLALAPLLARYSRLHPQVALEVCTDDAKQDIVAAGFDAGVRFSEHLPRDMVALPLGGAQRFAVVAAPALLARYPAPRHPRELQALPCIRQRFINGSLFRWEFRRGDEALFVDPPGPLTVDDQAVVLEAALAGAGAACVYACAAQESLRAGRLVELLADWCPPGTGFQLYYPGRRQASPALQALIQLLKADTDEAPPG